MRKGKNNRMFVGLHNHTDNGSNIRGFLDSTNTIKGLLEYTL